MSSIENGVCGVLKRDGFFCYMVLNDYPDYKDKNIKEILFKGLYDDEIDYLFGFEDVNIREVKPDCDEIVKIKQFLSSDECVGLIILDNGYLLIDDIIFVSMRKVVSGTQTPYTNVSSNTYEDCTDLFDDYPIIL